MLDTFLEGFPDKNRSGPGIQVKERGRAFLVDVQVRRKFGDRSLNFDTVRRLRVQFTFGRESGRRSKVWIYNQVNWSAVFGMECSESPLIARHHVFEGTPVSLVIS